jgi:ABC-type lipoprotein release transport system permease subunit
MRSLIVILSIAIGLFAGVFYTAFSWGMIEDHIESSINEYLSHIQIHEQAYDKTQPNSHFIPEGKQLLEQVSANKSIKASTGRTLVTGMVSSANAGSGVLIAGVIPDRESAVTGINTKIIEGDYFEGVKTNPVLIGKKLAEKLKVGLKSKIVLTFQDTNGEIVAGAFRVAGIYKTKNSKLDETNVYVKMDDVNRLLGFENEMNEIAILLNDNNELDDVKAKIAAIAKGKKVETWKQLSSELEYMVSMFRQYSYIFIVIILLALTFGIVNTMLMTVLERVRELGMLMAIGLNKTRLFFMIVLETIFLALVGGPLGILIAHAVIVYYGNVGIDLSMFSEAYESMGFSSIIYPKLEWYFYAEIGTMSVLAAIFAAIYPARKALQLNPSEAIRKI